MQKQHVLGHEQQVIEQLIAPMSEEVGLSDQHAVAGQISAPNIGGPKTVRSFVRCD